MLLPTTNRPRAAYPLRDEVGMRENLKRTPGSLIAGKALFSGLWRGGEIARCFNLLPMVIISRYNSSPARSSDLEVCSC